MSIQRSKKLEALLCIECGNPCPVTVLESGGARYRVTCSRKCLSKFQARKLNGQRGAHGKATVQSYGD